MNITPEALDFLFENKIKDSKEWYREHREIHKKLVVEPFREFVRNMQPYIEKIDKNLSCDPMRISRIYRDTRFTKDKSTFRDNVWYGFMHGRELYEGLPCYFFEFSPRGIVYGVGYYHAGTRSIEAIRELVKKHDKTYLKAKRVLGKHPEITLETNPYKKNRFPDADKDDLEWLNIRNFCAVAETKEFNLLFSDRLAEEMGKRFIELKPVYDFLMKAEQSVNRSAE